MTDIVILMWSWVDEGLANINETVAYNEKSPSFVKKYFDRVKKLDIDDFKILVQWRCDKTTNEITQERLIIRFKNKDEALIYKLIWGGE